MCKLATLIILFVTIKATNAATLYCSHAEVCRMARIIAVENKSTDMEFSNIIVQSGDPHEFEPGINDLKKLIDAPSLITGPLELNPWMKKITQLRNKEKHLYTVHLALPTFSKTEYPATDTEPLGHFWLYPKLYCNLKDQLTKIFRKSTFKCDSDTIEDKLKNDLKRINIPIILTHDALLPLLKKLATHKNQIIALKGSSHHEEVSAQAIKQAYESLNSPKVIWILEKNIHTPQNLSKKIRPTDIKIFIDTANSPVDNEQDFSLLELLHQKLTETMK